MNSQGPRKRLYGGEQALLESADQQSRSGLHPSRLHTEPFLSQLTIFVEKRNQAQLRGIIWQILDFFLDDMALWESANYFSEIVFKPTNHDIVERFSL